MRRTGQGGLVTPEAPGSWTLEMIDFGSFFDELGLRSEAAARSLGGGRSRNKSRATNANAPRRYLVTLVRFKVELTSWFGVEAQ